MPDEHAKCPLCGESTAHRHSPAEVYVLDRKKLADVLERFLVENAPLLARLVEAAPTDKRRCAHCLRCGVVNDYGVCFVCGWLTK